MQPDWVFGECAGDSPESILTARINSLFEGCGKLCPRGVLRTRPPEPYLLGRTRLDLGECLWNYCSSFLSRFSRAVLSINYPSTWDPTGLSRVTGDYNTQGTADSVNSLVCLWRRIRTLVVVGLSRFTLVFGYQIDFGRNFDYRYLLECSLNHQCLREFNVLVCFDIGQSSSIPRSAGIQYVGPCVLQPRHSISLFPWLGILESSRLKSLQ
jgi:hypothetical protein